MKGRSIHSNDGMFYARIHHPNGMSTARERLSTEVIRRSLRGARHIRVRQDYSNHMENIALTLEGKNGEFVSVWWRLPPTKDELTEFLMMVGP